MVKSLVNPSIQMMQMGCGILGQKLESDNIVCKISMRLIVKLSKKMILGPI